MSSHIIGIELLAAAQGCDFHAPLALEPAARSGARADARKVPQLEDDRYLAPDIAAATALVRSGAVIDAAGCEASAARSRDST